AVRADLRSAAKREPLTSFRCLLRDLAVLLDGGLEGFFSLVALVSGDAFAADAPELLDGANAPQGAHPRGPDRLAADQNVDRVGMHLREVPERHPAAAVDRHFKFQFVDFVV